jgi:hypothetical protein
MRGITVSPVPRLELESGCKSSEFGEIAEVQDEQTSEQERRKNIARNRSKRDNVKTEYFLGYKASFISS